MSEETEKQFQIEQARAEMKTRFDAQLLAEHQAGYKIVRAPLPLVGGCHACGSKNLDGGDVAPMFERDASTRESFMHVALVCAACKNDEKKLAELGDKIVAHGKSLLAKYGDAVVIAQTTTDTP